MATNKQWTSDGRNRSRRRRTRGAVDRLPSGRWRARFTSPDGRRLAAAFVTKASADSWLAAQDTDVGHLGRSRPGPHDRR